MLKNMQETLEYGFKVLNEVYFEGKLPPVVITIMSSRKTYGHFTVGRVWRAEGDRLNEINISAEHLDRTIDEIMSTLLHEMIHFYCQLEGTADTSQGGRYHNKNFKREAEARGLVISCGKYIGWSVTEPGEGFMEVLRLHGIEKPVDMNRDGGSMPLPPAGTGDGSGPGADGKGGGMDAGKRKTSTRKYVCPCCGNSFRATKDIRVMCMDCGKEFVKAGENGDGV